jgi:hypothetical protein
MVDITDDIERAKRFAGDHYLDPAARIGLDYHQVEATKRLWAEAGRGMVDFDAVMAAIPEDYDGDYMIEVVEPSVDSLYNSFKNGFRWARYALGLAKPRSRASARYTGQRGGPGAVLHTCCRAAPGWYNSVAAGVHAGQSHRVTALSAGHRSPK